MALLRLRRGLEYCGTIEKSIKIKKTKFPVGLGANQLFVYSKEGGLKHLLSK